MAYPRFYSLGGADPSGLTDHESPVYEELHSTDLRSLRYATFQLDDGVSFVHLHSDDSSDGSNALAELPAFKKFQEGISDRCEEGPIVTKLRVIGSFRLLEGDG